MDELESRVTATSGSEPGSPSCPSACAGDGSGQHGSVLCYDVDGHDGLAAASAHPVVRGEARDLVLPSRIGRPLAIRLLPVPDLLQGDPLAWYAELPKRLASIVTWIDTSPAGTDAYE